MGHYFKPRRRKIGVVTLLTASVLMAGWFRSLTTFTQVIFPLAVHHYISLVLYDQSFRIVWECDTVESSSWSDASLFSTPLADIAPDQTGWTDPENFCLNMPFRLRRKADWVLPRTYSVRTMSLPCWSLVVPLTLLSAALLLGKPRNEEKTAARSM